MTSRIAGSADSGNSRNIPASTDQLPATAAWAALRHTHTLVERHLSADLNTRCSISLTTYDILERIHRNADPTRLIDLLDVIPLSQPALSRTVDKLEAQGLLKRQPDPRDRRATVLTLTGIGRDTLDRATPVHAAAVHTYLPTHLTPERLAELNPIYLTKLHRRSQHH